MGEIPLAFRPGSRPRRYDPGKISCPEERHHEQDITKTSPDDLDALFALFESVVDVLQV